MIKNNETPLLINRFIVGFSGLILTVCCGCNETDTPGQPVEQSSADTTSSPDGGKPTQPTASNSTPPLADSPRLPSKDALARAQQLLTAKKPKQALQLINEVLLREPDRLGAIILAARALRQLGDHLAATRMLDAVATARPEHQVLIWQETASTAKEAGDLHEYCSRLERILSADPNRIETLREVATQYNQLGFRFLANERLRRLAKLSPLTNSELLCLISPAEQIFTWDDSVAPKNNFVLAETLQLLEQNQFSEAADLISKSAIYESRVPSAMALHGRILSVLGNTEQLADWIKLKTPEWEKLPDFWISVGNQLASSGHPREAADAFLRCVELEPLHRIALLRLSQTLQAAGDADVASRVQLRAETAKELTELATEAATPPKSANPCFVLSEQLQLIGLPIQSLAWQFNGAAIAAPQTASTEDYGAEAARLESTMDKMALSRIRRCGLTAPTQTPQMPATAETGSAEPTTTVAPAMPVTPNDIRLQNVAGVRGLNFQYRNADTDVRKHFLLHEALGGGVACLDIDLDGRTDVYAAQGGGDAREQSERPNYLARNLGDHFQNITTVSFSDDRGYSMGLTAGDLNQDGFPEIVVGNMQKNTLLINQGDGTFTPGLAEESWQHANYTSGLAIADVTGDGLADVIEVNYVDDTNIFSPIQYMSDGSPVRLPGPLQFAPATDRLLIATGDGSHESHALTTKHDSRGHRAMGLVVADIDQQPGNEIYVANDQTQNQLWRITRTQSGIRLSDLAVINGLAVGITGEPSASMGIAMADFDQNGALDFHVTNFDDELSNLYCQTHAGSFEDRSIRSKIAAQSRDLLGFGTQAADLDNNGLIDLIIGNGDIEDSRPAKPRFEMPTQLLANSGHDFVDCVPKDPSGYFSENHLTRSIATLDWNNDGRVDFVVGQLLEPIALLENQTLSDHHWLQISVVGRESARDAIGATIRITRGERTNVYAVSSGDGYMCRNQRDVFIGLGNDQTVNRIEIRWPSGRSDHFDSVSSDQRLLIIEGDSDPFVLTNASN